MVSMLNKNFVAGACSFILSLILIQCAGQIPPGGGPPDTVPPTIIRTVPDSNAVRVQTISIELEFSEYVDRRSVEESIFISPYVGELEFDWSGTSVKVSFSESLRKNTTYVVNIGTDVVDIRAGNRMAAGFTLAFTTGDSIDRGFISGRVFDEKPEGVMIFAYTLQGMNPDTLDPSRVKPDYIMQTGRGGTFTLANIAYGVYRLIAVRDEYRNLLYDKQIDQYGVTTADIEVHANRGHVRDVWFRLSREDTTRPFLTSVRALDRHHLAVRFSEAMDSLSFEQAVFSIIDTTTQRPTAVAVHYLNRSLPSLAGVVTATGLDSGATYRLQVERVYDRAGNAIDSTHASDVFAGSNSPDTLNPRISVRALTDSSRGYSPDQPIEIDFSEPVKQAPVIHAITLRDSSLKPVELELHWLNATDIELTPRKQLLSKAWYQIRVLMDSVRDLQGNGYKDSTFLLRFQTLDLQTTGVIEGTVADGLGEKGTGRIYLTASSIDLNRARQKTVRLERPGIFKIDRLAEGKYVINSFRDADSSGSYSFGLPYPFIASERFAVFPDTLKVRARWGVEGVLVRFK